MRVTTDFAEPKKLEFALKEAAALYPKAVVNSALRESAIPMLQAARQEAPIRQVRYGKSGVGQQGGATRRDLRIKTDDVDPSVLTSVLVGVSMKKGKAGRRTALITQGVRGGGRGRNINIPANDFIQRAFNRGSDYFYRTVGEVLGKRIEAYMAGQRYKK